MESRRRQRRARDVVSGNRSRIPLVMVSRRSLGSLYQRIARLRGNIDLWILSLEGKRERRAWMAGPSRELAAFFSPDGRSVAYVSDESGKNEVYVRTYPGAGAKIKISSEGGAEPAWAPDGREIFYRGRQGFMAVPIRMDPELSAGQPHPLFPDQSTAGVAKTRRATTTFRATGAGFCSSGARSRRRSRSRGSISWPTGRRKSKGPQRQKP